jgi:hypothetical protein
LKRYLPFAVSLVVLSLSLFGCSGGANPPTTSASQTTSSPATTNPSITTTAPAASTVTLTIVVDGVGQTSPAAGTHAYQKGAVVNLAAIGDIHWTFNLWLGTVADTHSATTTIIMNSDQTVTAYFSAVMD